MTKFKKGDRVRLIKECECPIDVGTICIVDKDFGDYLFYHTESGSHDCGTSPEYFELIGGSMNVGDILVSNDGDERKILAYLNQGVEVYMLSPEDNLNYAGAWYTAAEIIDRGWKLKTDTVTEKTVAELEKELGMGVGTLRIKK